VKNKQDTTVYLKKNKHTFYRQIEVAIN